MKPVDKDQLLDALEVTVNRHIQEAVELYQNMNSDLLLKPAADGGWSIAQCLEHLNRYGDHYLPLIRQGLNRHQGHRPVSTFTSSFIGSYFTGMMDPDKGKKKYKAFKEYAPVRELDAHAVVAEFIRQQEMLLVCLQWARRADLNKIKIPVSIMKWLKLRMGDVLQFIIAHNERHMRQAKRNCTVGLVKQLKDAV